MNFKTLLTKSLLTGAALLAGVSGAWATTKDVVETYDFENWGKAHMNKANDASGIDGYATMGTTPAGFKVNSVDMNQLHITSNKNTDSWDLGSRFAVSANTTFRWGKGGSDVPRLGNENAKGVRYISIVGLKAGDRVTLTCSNVTFYSTNATYLVESTPTTVAANSAVTDGTEYTITGTGWQSLDLSIASTTWGSIKKAVITRNVEVEEAYRWTLTGTDADVTKNDETITANSNVHNAATAPANCAGLYFYDSWKVYSAAGLRNISNGDRSLVIPNLKANDIIVFTGNEAMTTNCTGKYAKKVDGSTVTFNMESDDNFWFKMSKTTNTNIYQVTSIVVYREKEPLFADGYYYFKNKDTGGYIAAGQNWSTQAITNLQGHRMKLLGQPDGSYHINTYIYRGEDTGSDLHYLNDNFNDGAAQSWTLVDAGEGYYTLTNANGNLTASTLNAACSMTSGTGDNTKWMIMTEAEWKADQETRLATATEATGVDATFYIAAPDFNWADMDEREKWQGKPSVNGWDNNGSGRFLNAEKYNTTPFDVYQSLTGVKPGAYKVTCQGYYRNGTTDDRNALLYANSYETPLVNIKSAGITAEDDDKGFTTLNDSYYVPNLQDQAAKAFNNGYYTNELWFVVGEDGNLRIGVKKTTGAGSDWACFDNFQLTYYGETVSKSITAGWATYCSPYALDLAAATGLTDAYIVTGGSDGVLAKTSVKGGTVPANTGLLLKGAEGTATIPVVASSTTDVKDNILVGVTSDTKITKEAGWVLMDEAGGLGFYQNSKDFTVGANTAYIPVSVLPAPATGGARAFYSLFDSETTGVGASLVNSERVNNEVFNLQGQRVAQPTKGLYIVGGKKVVVK